MDAVKKGHVLGALWWLVHRADINALYPPASGVLEARTPLHEAVAHGQINMVAFLCLSGADVYQQVCVCMIVLCTFLCTLMLGEAHTYTQFPVAGDLD